MNIIEKAGDKLRNIEEKISNTDSIGKKVLWILALIGLLFIAILPFLVYFIFFNKDNTIEVDVKAEIDEVENSGEHNQKVSDSAIKKSEDILKNIESLKKAKKDLKEL